MYVCILLQSPSHNLKDLIEECKEEVYQCSTGPTFNNFQTSCSGVPRQEIEIRFHQDPYVSFVVKAVSALVAAFRLVQLEQCARDSKKSCLHRIHDSLHEDIVDNLRKLTFASMTEGGNGGGNRRNRGKGSRHHFSKGRLVANKQQVYSIDRDEGLEQVAITLNGRR